MAPNKACSQHDLYADFSLDQAGAATEGMVYRRGCRRDSSRLSGSSTQLLQPRWGNRTLGWAQVLGAGSKGPEHRWKAYREVAVQHGCTPDRAPACPQPVLRQRTHAPKYLWDAELHRAGGGAQLRGRRRSPLVPGRHIQNAVGACGAVCTKALDRVVACLAHCAHHHLRKQATARRCGGHKWRRKGRRDAVGSLWSARGPWCPFLDLQTCGCRFSA